MKPNYRYGFKMPKGITGPRNMTCPKCGAAPAWPCVLYSTDAEGVPYERRKMKTPHPARTEAWRAAGKPGPTPPAVR